MNMWTECRHFEALTSTDEEFEGDGEQHFTESGRLALHSETKRAEALEAQQILAGSPMMAAPGMDVDEPNQVEEPEVLLPAWHLSCPATLHVSRL